MPQRHMSRFPMSLAALAFCGVMLAGCGDDGNNFLPFDLDDPDVNQPPICSVLAAFVDLGTQEIVVDVAISDFDQITPGSGQEVTITILANGTTFANDIVSATSGNSFIGNTALGVNFTNQQPGATTRFRISSSTPQQMTNDMNAIVRVQVCDEVCQNPLNPALATTVLGTDGGMTNCELGFDLNLVSEPTCNITAPAANAFVMGNVDIGVDVMDNQGDNAELDVFYSLDGGATFTRATLAATTAGALGNTQGCHPAVGGAGPGVIGIPTTQGGAPTSLTVTWDSVADGVATMQLQNVQILIWSTDCTTVGIGGLFNTACTVDVQVLNNGESMCTVDGPVGMIGGTGNVVVDFTTMDMDSANLQSTVEWSTDMGATWNLATPTAPDTNPVAAAPGATQFNWDVPADIATASLPVDAILRVTVDDLTGRPTLPSCVGNTFTLVPISEPTCTITSPMAGVCVDAFPGGTIDIQFDLADAQGDPINFTVHYDPNGMGQTPATLTATSNGALAGYVPTNPAAVAGASNQVTGATGGATTITWDVLADMQGMMMCDNVEIVILPEDGTTAGAGPFFTCNVAFQVANNGAPSCTLNAINDTSFSFDLVDGDTAMVSCLFEYSLDGGATWLTATPNGGSNPENFAPGAGLSWGWAGTTDIPTCTMGVLGRVTVDDGVMLANRPATCTSAAADINCIPVLVNCRAVDTLGTTATGPTGEIPAYAGGGTTADIAGENPFAANYWDFDYLGLNTGAFNSTVQLTDNAGANVGNPVVLMTAGHDYSALMDGGMCNTADTFQVVLEGDVNGTLDDYAAGGMVNGATVTQTWMSSGAGITVADGLLTAVNENECVTIDWTLASSDPMLLIIDPTCASGSFVACVDSGGVDTTTRGMFLPVGDIDVNFAGMPSGMPAPAGVGSTVGLTFIVNTDTNGVGAYAARTEYDEMILDEDTGTDIMSIGGGTQSALGLPFAVNAGMANQTRWNDVDAFAMASGIFDLASQTYTTTGSGTVEVRYINEELADGMACNIWVTNPCMPFNSFVCPMPPPMGGYQTIAGTGDITVP